MKRSWNAALWEGFLVAISSFAVRARPDQMLTVVDNLKLGGPS